MEGVPSEGDAKLDGISRTLGREIEELWLDASVGGRAVK